MAGGVGFIRVKLLQVEKGSSMDTQSTTFDPYVAVNVKESVQTPGELTPSFKQDAYVMEFSTLLLNFPLQQVDTDQFYFSANQGRLLSNLNSFLSRNLSYSKQVNKLSVEYRLPVHIGKWYILCCYCIMGPSLLWYC